jgi:hypothetical protein
MDFHSRIGFGEHERAPSSEQTVKWAKRVVILTLETGKSIKVKTAKQIRAANKNQNKGNLNHQDANSTKKDKNKN